MGWGSGGEIFDLVAHGLIEAGASDEILDRVCYDLARALTGQDWDTVDESIDEFRGHPVVQHALRKADGWTYLGEYDEALLEFDAKAAQWVLYDTERGRGELARRVGTAEGHNELVELWFTGGPDAPDRRGLRERYLLG